MGLLIAGGGFFFGVFAATRVEPNLATVGAALVLFVLGSYLALAGNRSHLYQSNSQVAAYLAELIQLSKIEREANSSRA